jgi:hypothetical protein
VPHRGILAAVDAVEVKQLRPGEIGGSHVDQRRRCVNTEYGVRAFESIVQPFLIQGLRTLATTRDRTRRLVVSHPAAIVRLPADYGRRVRRGSRVEPC